jgi:preprotein translocase subunit YajC
MGMLILLSLLPIIVLGIIIYIIIRTLKRQNKGSIDYGNYALNILENNTTKDNSENR